MDHLESVEI